jgi:TRAP-type C4-dicarboxylate transport system permease small subunit
MRLIRIAERSIDALAVALFAAMFACVLGQVVFRYFLGSPLVWSDELARYLFVWCSFLGWIVAARRRSHLGIAMVGERLGARGAAVLGLVGALAALGFACVLAYYGTHLAARNLDVDTVALFFTIGAVYAIVPLAAAAVGLYALADARRALAVLRDPRGMAR